MRKKETIKRFRLVCPKCELSRSVDSRNILIADYGTIIEFVCTGCEEKHRMVSSDKLGETICYEI